MKATINKNDILPVLSKIQGLAGRKTNLEFLPEPEEYRSY